MMKQAISGIVAVLMVVASSGPAGATKSGSGDPFDPKEEQPPAVAGPGVPLLIGQYSVNDGPVWFDPATVAYTCQEGCAQEFGGSPTDYSCSTVVTAVDNLAWASSWGSPQHCFGGTPVAEDFKIGGPTDCGAPDCYKSAYVQDWCGSDSVNYCFAAMEAPATPPWALFTLLALLLVSALWWLRVEGRRRVTVQPRAVSS